MSVVGWAMCKGWGRDWGECPGGGGGGGGGGTVSTPPHPIP